MKLKEFDSGFKSLEDSKLVDSEMNAVRGGLMACDDSCKKGCSPGCKNSCKPGNKNNNGGNGNELSLPDIGLGDDGIIGFDPLPVGGIGGVLPGTGGGDIISSGGDFSFIGG